MSREAEGVILLTKEGEAIWSFGKQVDAAEGQGWVRAIFGVLRQLADGEPEHIARIMACIMAEHEEMLEAMIGKESTCRIFAEGAEALAREILEDEG